MELPKSVIGIVAGAAGGLMAVLVSKVLGGQDEEEE